MAMTLGTYEFDRPPSECTIITGDRITASARTYSGVAFFSWGTMLAGKIIALNWPHMPPDMFDDLAKLRDDDVSLEWDPEAEAGTTYEVEIIKLSGAYWINMTDEWRQNVALELLILREITS